MKTIAVDIDDVISSQTDALIEFSNKYYNSGLTRDDFKIPGEYWGYYNKVWNVGKEESDIRFRRFLDEEYPLKQIVTDETKAAIMQLKQGFNLDIVTSRHTELSEGTKKWLLSHFSDTFRGVHFVGLWDGGDNEVTKALICKKIGADFLIDDNAEHCNLAAEAGIKALLFGEFGWNSHQVLHNDVVRVRDWQEVLRFFDEQ